MEVSPASTKGAWLATAAMLGLLLVPFLLRLSLLETRGFNPDELEHCHWTWCVANGLVPYLDYFDHHTPWLHYSLAPVYHLFEAERVPDDAVAFVLTARRIMWVYTGLGLLLTVLLGRAWRDTRTGLVAALLLSFTAFFLNKSLEIRPAVPAAALVVLSLWLALVGVRRLLKGESGALTRLLASGLAIGAATMFTQKVLFIGPGYALVVLWLVLDPRLGAPRSRRLKGALLQTAGFLAPVLGTMAWFASKGALSHFIEGTFLVNTRWPGLGAGPFLEELVRRDPAFVVLGLAGLAAALVKLRDVRAAEAGEPVLALSALSLVATLPFHPGMSYQHFLLILPLFALYAAAALLRAVEIASKRLSLSLAAAPAMLLTAAVVALSVVPLQRFRESFGRGNWGTLEGIRYVIRNTSPNDTTFDGFTGLGMFRPQPFYHHFQYPHAFELQSEEEHREMEDALLSGRAMPKLIFWSHYLQNAVTPKMTEFLEKHYVPTGIEPIRVRPFDNGAGWWRDDTPRYLGWPEDLPKESPHVLFDDAWRPPTTEFGAPVRRTRTRRSTLTVPIRRPRDFDVVFRAHAEPEAIPFAVELVVNGHRAGVQPAVPRWQDYTFFVPVQHLIPGFNVFELKFSAEEDTPDKRLELAVNYLHLLSSHQRD